MSIYEHPALSVEIDDDGEATIIANVAVGDEFRAMRIYATLHDRIEVWENMEEANDRDMAAPFTLATDAETHAFVVKAIAEHREELPTPWRWSGQGARAQFRDDYDTYCLAAHGNLYTDSAPPIAVVRAVLARSERLAK